VTLQEQVQASMTDAMRQRDVPRRDTLRMVVAALYNAEKAARRPLSDDEQLAVLNREVKMRRESVDAYTKAGRPDLADREAAEAVLIGTFMPAALDEAQLMALVDAAIAETGASSARDLGRVMTVLAPRTRGRADGRTVSGLVAQALARRDLEGHAHGPDAA
jgi:uncharacterized protein